MTLVDTFIRFLVLIASVFAVQAVCLYFNWLIWAVFMLVAIFYFSGLWRAILDAVREVFEKMLAASKFKSSWGKR